MDLTRRRALATGAISLLAGAAGAGVTAAAADTTVATGAEAGLPFPALQPVPYWPIWPHPPTQGHGASIAPAPRIVRGGAIAQIATPFLSVFRPARPNGSAMLVAGGGGYEFIEMLGESLAAASWLNGLGITAFVIGYRLPNEGWTEGGYAPLADARRAIRLIRARATELGLDRHRIGGLGFSAGGHLTGLAAAAPGWQIPRPSDMPADAIDRLDDRLDCAMLLYPVITVEAPYQTTHTSRVLLGADRSPANAALWSVQTHIGPSMPPVFTAQAADDRIASPQNSAILQAACLASGVPCERHLYPDGGHGFGMGRPGTQSVQWPDAARAWLAGRGYVTS